MTLRELVEAICKKEKWEKGGEEGRAVLTVPQAGGRSQRVAVTEFKDEGAAHARFTSVVGPVSKLDAARLRNALELNFRLPHGSLAIDGDHLVLTETRPLGTTTPATSAAAIKFIAKQADTYEKFIFGTDEH